MPFTLSHAAAVLPGIRRTGAGRGPLAASALVAGSFAPDITYYADTAIPGAMEFGEVTHSVLGVFTVDVLIAALLVACCCGNRWWPCCRRLGRAGCTRSYGGGGATPGP